MDSEGVRRGDCSQKEAGEKVAARRRKTKEKDERGREVDLAVTGAAPSSSTAETHWRLLVKSSTGKILSAAPFSLYLGREKL